MGVEFAEIRERSRDLGRLPLFEDFRLGQRIDHKWGRTLTESDNLLFSTLTVNGNPRHFNRDFAQQQGHRDLVVNPMLLTMTVLGLSVQDLSEAGGAFLGIRDLVYRRPVLIGETVTASSEVLAARRSSSRPGMGIVTWRTVGRAGTDDVVSFIRTNMIPARTQEAAA